MTSHSEENKKDSKPLNPEETSHGALVHYELLNPLLHTMTPLLPELISLIHEYVCAKKCRACEQLYPPRLFYVMFVDEDLQGANRNTSVFMEICGTCLDQEQRLWTGEVMVLSPEQALPILKMNDREKVKRSAKKERQQQAQQPKKKRRRQE